jgi:diacylglycerol kinase (ATP)
VGFDAIIASEFANYGKRGFSSYMKIIFREITKIKSQIFEITIEGKTQKYSALMISAANGSQFGNNFFIAPYADIKDGKIELIIMKEFPLYVAPLMALKFFTRKHHISKYIETLRIKEFLIHQSTPLVHIDGEPLFLSEDLHFKINPLSLNVIVP